MIELFSYYLFRVSLVVTETFDAGLLGEHVLTSLQHAWADMLIPLHPADTKTKNDTSMPKVKSRWY